MIKLIEKVSSKVRQIKGNFKIRSKDWNYCLHISTILWKEMYLHTGETPNPKNVVYAESSSHLRSFPLINLKEEVFREQFPISSEIPSFIQMD